MGSNQISINLSSPQLVYYPGKDISGVIVLVLNKAEEVKTLVIKLLGKSLCRFKGRTGKYGRGEDAHTQIYSNENTTIEDEINLADTLFDGKSSKVNLSPGKHEYEFKFHLSSHLPSSFESTLGRISYVLSVEIGDHKLSRDITVNEIIDANLPEHIRGSSGESNEDIRFFGKLHGKLDIKGRTDRFCYCPGEPIYLTVKMDNNTTKELQGLKAKLVQTIKYHTDTRTKKIEKVIATLKGCKIPKGETLIWEKQPFGIPAIPPSISNCKILSVEYDVRIEVAVRCGNDIGIKMPIIIGTVPNVSYANQIVIYGTKEDPKCAPQSNIIAGPLANVEDFGYPYMIPPCYSSPIGRGLVMPSSKLNKLTKMEIKNTIVYTFAKTSMAKCLPDLVTDILFR